MSPDVSPQEVERSKRETRVARVIASCSDQLNAGARLDIPTVLAKYPDIAAELQVALHMLTEVPAPPCDRPLGSFGDYTLIRELGRGGMGVVYEAWQHSMARRVALKVLPAGIAADERAYSRFLREAHAAGRLHHPSIVSVHAMGLEENTPYYAMEYVEGSSLDSLPDALPEPPQGSSLGWGSPSDGIIYFGRVARAFAGVADGLQHAHGHGVIHRDIKPGNLILDSTGRLRLLDFGLARLEGHENLTRSGDFVGTPLYMSPEQAQTLKIPVTHRSDIYSLGATLYVSLTGSPPHQGKSQQDTLSRILECDPRPPRAVNSSVPRPLETIVLKCLRKDPQERYGTAEALSQDLRRFVRGDPIEARPQSLPEKLIRQFRRYKRRAIVGGVFLSLVVALGVVSLNLFVQKAQDRQARYEQNVREAVMRLQLGILPAELTGNVEELHGASTYLRPDKRFVFEDALVALQRAAALSPDRPEAPYHRARGLQLLGLFDKAREEVEEALRKSPDFVPAATLRASILGQDLPDEPIADSPTSSRWAPWMSKWVAAQRFKEERRWRDAERAYSALIALGKDHGEFYVGSSVETRLGRGIARLGMRDFLGATEDFGVARAMWSDSPVPSLLLGQTFILFDDSPRAFRVFEELFQETSPEGQDAVALEVALLIRQHDALRDVALSWIERMRPGLFRERGRVRLLIESRRYEQAAEIAAEVMVRPDAAACDAAQLAWASAGAGILTSEEIIARIADALRRGPDDRYTLYLCGRAYAVLGRFDTARDLYEQAQELDPRFAAAAWESGWMLVKQGRVAEAEEYFRLYLERFPDSAVGQATLARCCLKRNKIDEALAFVGIALELNPGFAYGYLTRATILRLQGDADRAEEDYQRCLALSPRSRKVKPLVLLAKLYRCTDRLDEALDCLNQALAIDALDPSALQLKASIYREQGDPDEAFERWRKSVDRCGECVVERSLLAKLLREKGRYDESLRYLSESLARSPLYYWSHYELRRMLLAPVRMGGEKSLAGLIQVLQGIVDGGDSQQMLLEHLAAARGALAWAQGDAAHALELLEALGSRFPRRRLLHLPRVRALRAEVFPDLPSYGAVDAALDGQSLGSDRELQERFLEASGGQDRRQTARYLDARILERHGALRESLSTFEALSSDEPDRPEPWVRRLEVLLRLGERGVAGKVVLQALERLPNEPQLWSLWVRLNSTVGGRVGLAGLSDAFPTGLIVEASEALTAVDRRVESASEDAVAVSEYLETRSYWQDVLWLVSRLAAGKVVRINCGGIQREDREGQLWGRDAFYRGGRVSLASAATSVEGTDSPEIYRAARTFDAVNSVKKYSLPVPDGCYRVVLHFAELYFSQEGKREFGILLEGESLAESYRPSPKKARTVAGEVCVTDGWLDIQFDSRKDHPKVSGIEVEALVHASKGEEGR